MITQEQLKQILSYDPETGDWMWLAGRREGFVAGSTTIEGYRYINIGGKKYRASRLAYLYMTGKWPEHEVDHKNRIRNDERWVNLREATHQQNCINRKSKTHSLPRGVNKRGVLFEASCKIKGKRHYLGLYSTPERAHEAYKEFRMKNHGDYICQ
jgi:hypothetical protein